MTEYTKIIQFMGTKISLYIKGNDVEGLIKKAEDMLIHYNELFSANSDHSQLAMLKKTAAIAPQKVDDELYELIKTGKKHSLYEDTYLIIAIGPLIKLWRIGFKEAHVPDKDAIENVLELLNPENVQLNAEEKTIHFLKKGMEIDLGAIAKGYFADKVMELFKEHGAVSAMVALGGNVLFFGEAPSEGYPIESNIASLTVIADSSLDCDTCTTKLFGLDAASIIHRVNRIGDMGAVVITLDGDLAYTNNLREKIIPFALWQ
jgi:FAD:protein FMN transferase